ncbi:MAG: HEAT repeat domain-containing protein, partial [Verrucomicrobia bacterium]|nr:HEAT repeat domain-containing protein [Verrucomicrobiota bacterium]
LEYALWLSINDLAPTWIQAIQSGTWKPAGHEKQLEYGLKAIEPDLASKVLARLLGDRPLPRDGSGPWIDLFGSAAGPEELRRLFDQVLAGGFDLPASRHALHALAEADRLRNVKPTGNLDPLEQLFDQPDASIRAAACRLAGGWKLTRFAPRLLALAGQTNLPEPMRQAVFFSLREMGGTEVVQGLRALCRNDRAPVIRRQAAVALAAVDRDHSMPQVLSVISTTTADTDALALWRALLGIRDIDKALVRALPASGLPEPAAKAGLRVARETGRNDTDLILALGRGGNLSQEDQGLTPAEMQALVARVQRQGDPARGEAIFRRKDVGCTTCHAIGGVGGKVGPDLTSIGASSPVDYLIESVLQPNKKIKEGYQAVLVTTRDGNDYSGILVREDERELILRNALNQEISIPKKNIESRSMGGSLMPSGLTDILSPSQRIDLFRFLSELGKPGPYDASKGNVARLWRVHTMTAGDEQNGSAWMLHVNLNQASWHPVYTLVDGRLPMAELQEQINSAVFGGPIALYAANRFQVPVAGNLVLRLTGAGYPQAWIDGNPVATGPEIHTALAAGPHTIVLRFEAKQLPAALRLASPDATFLTD